MKPTEDGQTFLHMAQETSHLAGVIIKDGLTGQQDLCDLTPEFYENGGNLGALDTSLCESPDRIIPMPGFEIDKIA